MTTASPADRKHPDRAIELLNSDEGINISDLADELEVTRSEARDVLSQIDEEYELGSSSDFRYRILRKLDSDREEDL